MGTRSVIAIPQGDGWKGRYVHWDGYPDGVGEAVRQIIARDGLETATRVLTQEHNGWSTVTAAATVEADRLDPDRFVVVHGYGLAYSHDEQPDEWVTDTGDDWGTEWAYVLTPAGVVVLENANGWAHRDVLRYDAEQLTLAEVDPVLQAGGDSGHVVIVEVKP